MRIVDPTALPSGSAAGRAQVATVAMLVLAACGTEQLNSPDLPQPLDVVWTESIHAGDVIALVPGTGSHDYLAATIEPLPGSEPLVDVRAIPKVADDAIVFEQAIAAAHRAGISSSDLEAGALTFGLWGAGFTRLKSFVYVSYEGLHVRVEILGGANSCAYGRVIDNLFNYTPQNAERDARDLHAKLQAWLVAHPVATPRNVIVASHSWGGAVAEYLVFERATIEATTGPLSDGNGIAPMPFTIAAGVPAYMPNYVFAGPGLRDVAGTSLYEIDRPDDPVHAMNPSGNPNGHQYDILFGVDFQGSYGVTTTELSCLGVTGACPTP